MTQPTNKQVTPLIEFVDSVFAELSSHTNEWNPHEEGYGYYDNPDCLKDTLIPLAKRLYELAQVDDKVYWWLLQLMSQDAHWHNPFPLRHSPSHASRRATTEGYQA